MTNKEIKLELCKAMLHNPNFVPTDLQKMYEWILKESETHIETVQRENIDIKELLNCIRKNKGPSSGITEMLTNVFYSNNVKSVDDLLKIGRRDFSKFRTVGKKSLWAIDDALCELGIKGW